MNRRADRVARMRMKSAGFPVEMRWKRATEQACSRNGKGMFWPLLDQGRDIPEIARALFISNYTVKNHMRNVAEKLQLWVRLWSDEEP